MRRTRDAAGPNAESGRRDTLGRTLPPGRKPQIDARYRWLGPHGRARLRRALINLDDSRQPKRAIPGSRRPTNAKAFPIATS
jgi:hypothetical protein